MVFGSVLPCRASYSPHPGSHPDQGLRCPGAPLWGRGAKRWPRTIRGVAPGFGLWALGPGESHTFIHPFNHLVFFMLWEGAGLPSEGSQSSPLKLTF